MAMATNLEGGSSDIGEADIEALSFSSFFILPKQGDTGYDVV